MARKLRLESNAGLYHIINRGNYRSHIFKTEGAKDTFIRTLFEACDKFSWELSAFCLMRNHYHLCIGTPQGNLSAGMRWLQATFAVRFNKFRKEQGHLFQGRFKSLAVEPGEHWLKLVDYIHLNPVRAGLADVGTIGKYPWSSLFYFPKRKDRPNFLKCNWMDYFEDFDDSKGGWIRYQNHLRLKSTQNRKEIDALDRELCRGWSVGSPAFTKAVSDELSQHQAVGLEREELVEFNRIRWETYLGKCLKQLGKKESDAKAEKLSVDWKLAIAAKLKQETSVTNAWLTDHLHMGTARSVSAICGIYIREKEANCGQAKLLRKLTIDR